MDDFEKIRNTFESPPDVPAEWMALIRNLHPITAIVVWEVLTNRLSPHTITLAQYSPDWDRYVAMRIVGGGNAAQCAGVAKIARPELEEIFADVLSGDIPNPTYH